MPKSNSQKEVCRNITVPQETGKISDNQSNLIPSNQREKDKKLEVSKMKEIRKTRAKINEIEMKKTIEKNNQTKSWLCEKISKINKPLARLIKKKKKERIHQ